MRTAAKVVPFCYFVISAYLMQLTFQNERLAVDLINATLGQEYRGVVSDGHHRAFIFSLDSTIVDFDRDELRLEVELLHHDIGKETPECPLLVTVSQGKQVNSYELPHELNSSLSYDILGKTICLVKGNGTLSRRRISVVLATCNEDDIDFALIMRHGKDKLALNIGQENNITVFVAPTTPRFYHYHFGEEEKSVLVIMKSPKDTNSCMTVSVQQMQCPVFDESNNIRYTGFWQAFSTLTGITVSKKDFPGGFTLVMATDDSDKRCIDKDGNDADRFPEDDTFSTFRGRDTERKLEREKQVLLYVQRVLSPSEYAWPTILPLVVYAVTILLTFIMYIWFHKMSVEQYETLDEKPDVKCCLRSEKYISEGEVDGFKREELERKSQRYFWLLVTVSVFYCIPVFQLIINYLSIVHRTGEQDLCYYNNLCSLPLNKVMDFNHIYSNIGYIIFGGLFIVFTFIRQATVEARRAYFAFQEKPFCCGLLEHIPRRVEYGTFDQYGIFYSLGFALFMEGFLSASYHICPNKANFQFDTSFMYAMAVLGYVKVYQFRHFLYMNELMAICLLGMVVGTVMVGLLLPSLTFQIVLSFVHVVFVVAFQLLLLFMSRNFKRESVREALDTSDDESQVNRMWGVMKDLVGLGNNSYLIKYHPSKTLFWWTMGCNLLLVVAAWAVFYGTNFATQVLYVLLANLIAYVVYYLIMKYVHGEFSGLFTKGMKNTTLQPLLYGVFTCAFGFPGLINFRNEHYTWDLSPAQSKEQNESCMFLRFYDNHDMWHLLSAPALFFAFMMLLTIDDGIIGRHHDSIPVF